MTSHDVVQRVRRVLGTRAAGHTGTLDPFATGLLVVLLGRATRLARFVETQSKTYLATGRLGIRTDTDDLTGQVVETSDAVDRLSEEQVAASLAGFLGSQPQRPPQYSAKHVGGERSYAKARRGEVVELPEVTVTVRRIELVEFQAPLVTFRSRGQRRDLSSRHRPGPGRAVGGRCPPHRLATRGHRVAPGGGRGAARSAEPGGDHFGPERPRRPAHGRARPGGTRCGETWQGGGGQRGSGTAGQRGSSGVAGRWRARCDGKAQTMAGSNRQWSWEAP